MTGVALPTTMLGALLIVTGAGLGGLGDAGGWAAGLFALISAGLVLLVPAPENWASPLHFVVAVLAAAIVAVGVFWIGRWLNGTLSRPPHWGAFPPLAMSAAGLGFALYGPGGRR